MPYIPRIPAITTGISDFIMISGFQIPIPEMPAPDLNVP